MNSYLKSVHVEPIEDEFLIADASQPHASCLSLLEDFWSRKVLALCSYLLLIASARFFIPRSIFLSIMKLIGSRNKFMLMKLSKLEL